MSASAARHGITQLPGIAIRTPFAAVVSALIPMLVGVGAVGLGACGGEREVAVRDSVALAAPHAAATDTGPPVRREVMAVQLAAFADSTAALRLRDSLASAGWQAHVLRGAGDSLPAFRVRVAPTRELTMAQMTAVGFVQRGWKAAIVADSAVLRTPTVQALRANDGTAGAIAVARWRASPDGRAMVVVEDAAGVENEPLPDGFIYVSDGGAVIQRDSVWDVAPSPDWGRLAYGSAFIISVRGRDSVAVRQWAVVAGRTNLDVNVVRRGAFPVSSMNHDLGFAQPVVEPTHPDSQGRSRLLDQVRRPVPVSGGWRLRWTADGRTLAVGLSPTSRARDDSPPAGWLAVDADDYLLRGPLSEGRAVQPTWTMGPVIDASVPLPLERRRAAVAGGWVESEGGWVVMQATRTGGARQVVGPGVLLGATRSGEFVAAIAPDPSAGKEDPPVRTVVYRLTR